MLLAFASCSRQKPPQPSPAQPPPQAAAAPPPQAATAPPPQAATPPPAPTPDAALVAAGTDVVMHNVILIKGDGLRLRVKWLRGHIFPTRKNVPPSFDDPKSFDLNIETGAMGVALSDLSSLLGGSGALAGTPLTNISLTQHGNQLLVHATLHKGIPLPVELIGTPSAAPDGRLKIHVDSLRVLKVPVKSLLKAFKVETADLFAVKNSNGLDVQGNDIYLEPSKMLPPPREFGKLSDVHLKDGILIQLFGNGREEARRRREWRNYFRLRGGVIEFGKITMRYVDIALIDTSNDPWFEFDLSRYQEQLVSGVTHMTPQAGLQIFMPDLSRLPKTRATSNIRMEWVKNRSLPPPPEVLK